MNFFEHQARARSRSRWLVLVLVAAVAAVAGAVAFVAFVVAALASEAPVFSIESAREFQDVFAWTALITLGVIGCASLYRALQLRSGGGAVARSLGAVRLPAQTTNERQRRLRNVVEEIAIAAGVPVPEIYLLEREAGINAFAAGYSPADAAIAVTQGCLDKLTRDELQGVIAHEFSHVLNGDMRLNVRLIGALFGVLAVAWIGTRILRGCLEADDVRAAAGGGAIGIAITLVGAIGWLAARCVQAGVSRTREYLADASAVQFTRQTSGIAGALKKIGGLSAGSKLASADAGEVAHMLFGDGGGFLAMFRTHPPLLDRIRRLEPRFDPREISARSKEWNDPSYAPLLDGLEAPIAPLAAGPGPVLATLDDAVARAGNPSAQDFRNAEALHRALPRALLAAVHEADGAAALILALLVDADPALAARQLDMIGTGGGAHLRRAAEALLPEVRTLPPAQRLPLVTVAFPVLRNRPREQLTNLLRLVSRLTHADGRVAAFEFALGRLLRTLVADALRPPASRAVGKRRLADCAVEAQVLLCTLAQQGHAGSDAARRAFAAGAAHALPQGRLQFQPPPDWHAALDAALRTLDQLAAPGKQLLVEALVKTISHDRQLMVAEAELLRVVCAALHCPLPPLTGPAA